MFVHLELRAHGANLVWLQVTNPLLAPAVTAAKQDSKTESAQARLAPERGNARGAAPLCHNRPRHQIGGPDLRLMAVRDLPMLKPRLGLLE